MLVGEVERQVVELGLARVGDAGRLGERLERDVPVLEERDGLLGAELEEVVPERPGVAEVATSRAPSTPW